jgi:hypothetical protein
MKKPKTKKSLLLRIIKSVFLLCLVLFIVVFISLLYLQFHEVKTEFNLKEASLISYTPPVKIVPSKRLPEKLKIYRSNNNLDIVKYKDKFYFAFRTAPTHFASKNTVIYVLSSSNLEKWDYETEFKFGCDLREPRFLVFKDKLFLYFFQAGSNPLSFTPKGIFVSKYISKGNWTTPKQIYKEGYVVWRVKAHKGKAYMSVYYGVGLYSNENQAGHLQLLESDDGYNYRLVNGKEIKTEYRGEEGEFEFDEQGNLYATIRFEWQGGAVCFANRKDITDWKCKFTTYKYDSALMFRHKNDFYVIARRNLDGPFNKTAIYLPAFLRSKYYLVRYSLTRKRTTLYKLNKELLTLEPVLDFPTRGDTAYAGITEISPTSYLVFNYSSEIDGFDWSWLGGQLTGSNIYSMIVKFKNVY